MKLWPFNRPELRDQNYTDAVTQGLLSQASGEVTAGLTSAVEICAGWWGRAFSSAEVRPAGILADALKLHLSTIGRRLVTSGEIVFALDFSGGLTFLPASTVTVKGGPNPRSWVYELTLPGRAARSRGNVCRRRASCISPMPAHRRRLGRESGLLRRPARLGNCSTTLSGDLHKSRRSCRSTDSGPECGS